MRRLRILEFEAIPAGHVNGARGMGPTAAARCCVAVQNTIWVILRAAVWRYSVAATGLEDLMPLKMPQSDAAVLKRRAEIVVALKQIVPGEGVIDSEVAMRPFEIDGLTAYRQLPMVVVLPETTAQVAAVLGFCHREGVKLVPRGVGTSLSGGALPLGDGVLLGLAKFNRIREIDYDNRVVVAEPGVTNLAISSAVAHEGFYYAPDPSSQIACTIGGNVAENSGGVH